MVVSGVQFVLVERKMMLFGAVENKVAIIQIYFWKQVYFLHSTKCVQIHIQDLIVMQYNVSFLKWVKTDSIIEI